MIECSDGKKLLFHFIRNQWSAVEWGGGRQSSLTSSLTIFFRVMFGVVGKLRLWSWEIYIETSDILICFLISF